MKRIVRTISPLVLCMILLTVVFFPGHLCYAVGDVGIVVEKVDAKEGAVIDVCKYCGKLIKTGAIHSDAEKIVKEKLQKALTENGYGYKYGAAKQPYINVLIYRFQERRGGNFAAEKPAGIGLHMHLIEGTVVGRTFVFDEDQKALSQDILSIGKFFRRGGQWITVEALAEEGINKGTGYLLEILP